MTRMTQSEHDERQEAQQVWPPPRIQQQRINTQDRRNSRGGEREKLNKKRASLSNKYGACELSFDMNDKKTPPTLHLSSSPANHDGMKNGHRAGMDKNLSQISVGVAAVNNDELLSTAPTNKTSILERAAERIPGLGIILALIASLFLGTAGMLVKMTNSVHGIQVAVFRAVIQLLIYAFIISLRRLSVWPERRELLPVMGRALLGATSITLSYYALKLIPLGDATTIRFSLPIWTLIIGYFILGESCNPLKVAAVIISISGVVLIAKPDDCIYLANWIWRQLGLESEREFARHWQEHEQSSLREHQQQLTHLMAADQPEPDLDPEFLYGGGGGGSGSNSSAGLDVVEIVSLLNTNQDNSSRLVGRVATVAPDEAALNLQQLEGCLMALGSSICLSLSLIFMRLCRQTPTEIIILWLSICSIAIGSGTLLALGEWRLPDNLLDYIFILLNGLCGAIGQWFITSALKVEQSGIIALARTFDIEVAFLYSALLLHEQIRTTSIIGSVLVSSGVVIVVLPKWLGSRNNTLASSDNDDERAARRQHTEFSYGLDQQQQQQQQTTPADVRQDSALGSTDESSLSSEDESRRNATADNNHTANCDHKSPAITKPRSN